MVRIIGLDDDLPFGPAATGPARDLTEQLKGSFTGAEIR